MSVVSNAVTTIGPTIVTGDRPAVTDVGTNAIYSWGSEFAQTLAQIQPNPKTLDALQQAGLLKTPDTTSGLATLAQASTLAADGQSPGQATPTGTMAQLQQLLQAGGQQLQSTSRLGLNLTS